jgi:hypothetical protein
MNKDAQQALNTKLADAAENGNLSGVTASLNEGAEINGRHCLDGCRHTPLMKASIKGNLSIVTLLLERGADPTLLGSEGKTAMELARDNNKTEVVTRIRSYEDDKSPDRVLFSTRIGNRIREDIYDFAMKERVTLIRPDQFAAVESALITGFSEIEDQSDGSMLRKAFNEHVKRGGKTDESEVFARRVFKNKPGLQKAP